MRARHQHVDRRNHKQGECRSDDHAADQHDADAITGSGSGALRQHEREMADDGCRRGHQDRAQTGAGSLDNGRELVSPLLLQVIGKLHDQNAIFRYEPHQRDQADLAVDVQRREPDIREQQSSRESQGN